MIEIVVGAALEWAVDMVANFVSEEVNLPGVAEQVELMKADLRRLQSFLADAGAKWRNNGDERVNNWVRDLREVAYDAENIVGFANYITRRSSMKRGFSGALSRYARKPRDLKSLRDIGAKIERIQRKLRAIFDSTSVYGINHKVEESPRMEDEILHSQRLVSPHSDDDINTDVVIGFENDREQIVEKLLEPENDLLTVISIVGMGGLGKSTLARKVYNSPEIKQHFDVFAWIVVSQKYEVSDLLRKIMKQTMGNKSDLIKCEELDKGDEEIIRNMLCTFLKKKRYLIVLDDVWKSTTWGQLQSSIRVFPEANRGSRVIFTTRSLDVARHANQRTFVHELKFLGEEESWELLRSKAFPRYENVSASTANELEFLGRKLAKKCKGLPLSLVVLGGYLSKNLNYNSWSKMTDIIDWEAMNNDKNLRDILALSYHDLPHHYLKSCFLHVASFPEDYVISVSRLIELWIAEGLVPHRQGHKLEDIARDYLDELAKRCMIQVAKRSETHGWIKRIRIHDVLRDWAIEEGAKDGFIKICSTHTDFTTSPDAMPAYRITLHDFLNYELSAAMPKLRTLLAFNLTCVEPCLHRLQFLRVLHLEGLRHFNFPKGIKRMIHLRYLGFRNCSVIVLPSSIRHLLNLQTLDARGTVIKSLSSSFWNIPSLRHVYLEDVIRLTPPKPCQRRNLQSLYLKDDRGLHRNLLRHASYTRGGSVLGMSDLVTLKLTSRYSISTWEVFSEFPNLCVLELKGKLQRELPYSSFFPQNLRKLELNRSFLQEDPMPILEKLPNLVKVILLQYSYEGRMLSCSNGGFPRLQNLTLINLCEVEGWKVEAGAMPRLSALTLAFCSKLRIIPKEGLLRLTSLQRLRLTSMPQQFTYLSRELEEKGCKVIIEE